MTDPLILLCTAWIICQTSCVRLQPSLPYYMALTSVGLLDKIRFTLWAWCICLQGRSLVRPQNSDSLWSCCCLVLLARLILCVYCWWWHCLHSDHADVLCCYVWLSCWSGQPRTSLPIVYFWYAITILILFRNAPQWPHPCLFYMKESNPANCWLI